MVYLPVTLNLTQGMIYDIEVKCEKHLRGLIWLETIKYPSNKIGSIYKVGLTKTKRNNLTTTIIDIIFFWNRPYQSGIGAFKTMWVE